MRASSGERSIDRTCFFLRHDASRVARSCDLGGASPWRMNRIGVDVPNDVVDDRSAKLIPRTVGAAVSTHGGGSARMAGRLNLTGVDELAVPHDLAILTSQM